MTIFLHAGPGSSTDRLAYFLRANARRIGRKRLLRPPQGHDGTLACFGIQDALLPSFPERQASDADRAAAATALASAAPTWKPRVPVLMACNALGRLTRSDDIRAVHDLLAPLGREVRIVFHLLPQDRLLEDAYGPYVLAGGTDARLDMAADQPLPPWFDYRQSLDLWSDVFGDEALIVRPLPTDETTVALAEDFLEIVGLTPREELEGGEDRATSLAAIPAELMRRINLRIAESGDPGLQARRAEIAALLLQLGSPAEGTAARMPPMVAAQLRERFAAGNAEVARRFFAGDASLFSPRRDGDAAPSRITDSDIAAIAALTARLLGGRAAPAPDNGASSGEKMIQA